MRIKHVLFRQHLQRMFKKHWIVQGKRVPIKTPTEQILKSKGIKIVDPETLKLESQPEISQITICPDFRQKRLKLDETHPNWHEKPCLMFCDSNVLLEGLDQTKLLIKTIQVTSKILKVQDESKIEKQVNNAKDIITQSILSSRVFDAEQKKLPKLKDPTRPAWNFPRVLGITHSRRSYILTSKLLQLAEGLASPYVSLQRQVIDDAWFSFPFEKEDDLIQIQLRADKFITSVLPHKTAYTESTNDSQLPNLFPLKSTVSIERENIYELENIYPVNFQISPYRNPHTIIVHHDITEVANLHETEVTETQIFGRSLMKSFTVAAAFARQKYGVDVKDLPEPVTVQCIYTDGRLFHFALFQLNTLNLNGTDGIKNVWSCTPRMPLFHACKYKDGRPILEGYNSNVVKQFLGFYNN